MTNDLSDFKEAIRRVQVAEREAVEETAKRVLEAVKGAGVVSLMPNGALPLTGLLLAIHPDVYDRVRQLSKPPAEPQP